MKSSALIYFTRLLVLFSMVGGFALVPTLCAEKLKQDTVNEFESYAQAAERKMNARKDFLLADSDHQLHENVLKAHKIDVRLAPGAVERHEVEGGLIHDWIGTVFVPQVNVKRTIDMLQDYDDRSKFFPGDVLESKTLCKTGDHFRTDMTIKEFVLFDTVNDIVWENVIGDEHRRRSRSISTRIIEAGHAENEGSGYLWKLNSYWRFFETQDGVYIEGEVISLTSQIARLKMFAGQKFGISPQHFLERTLASIRTTLLDKRATFHGPPPGLPQCE